MQEQRASVTLSVVLRMVGGLPSESSSSSSASRSRTSAGSVTAAAGGGSISRPLEVLSAMATDPSKSLEPFRGPDQRRPDQRGSAPLDSERIVWLRRWWWWWWWCSGCTQMCRCVRKASTATRHDTASSAASARPRVVDVHRPLRICSVGLPALSRPADGGELLQTGDLTHSTPRCSLRRRRRCVMATAAEPVRVDIGCARVHVRER